MKRFSLNLRQILALFTISALAMATLKYHEPALALAGIQLMVWLSVLRLVSTNVQ